MTGEPRHVPVEGEPPVDLYMVLNLTQAQVLRLEALLYTQIVELGREAEFAEVVQADRTLLRLVEQRVYQDIDNFRACAIEPEEEL